MAGDGEGPSSSTPNSPSSTGFNSDQLPHTDRSLENFTDDDYDDDEAAVDPVIVRDEPEEVHEEEDGEDLFNDTFMESVWFLFLSQFPLNSHFKISICLWKGYLHFYEIKRSDYRRMNEHDQYESLGLDDSLEDERDLDQIMRDRRAAELELDTRDGRNVNRKLPQLLHDQGSFYYILVPIWLRDFCVVLFQILSFVSIFTL